MRGKETAPITEEELSALEAEGIVNSEAIDPFEQPPENLGIKFHEGRTPTTLFNSRTYSGPDRL